MGKMFDKEGNHLSAREICLVYGKDETLEVKAEEFAALEALTASQREEMEHYKLGIRQLRKALDEAEDDTIRYGDRVEYEDKTFYYLGVFENSFTLGNKFLEPLKGVPFTEYNKITKVKNKKKKTIKNLAEEIKLLLDPEVYKIYDQDVEHALDYLEELLQNSMAQTKELKRCQHAKSLLEKEIEKYQGEKDEL